MHKLILWVFSTILLAAMSFQAFGESYERITTDKLPTDVQLKDVISEYPITLNVNTSKSIFRVTNIQLINKGKSDTYPILKKLEIIIDDKVIFSENFAVQNEFSYDKENDRYTYLVSKTSPDIVLFKDFKIFNGETSGYFAYFLEYLPSGPMPDEYNLVKIITGSKGIETSKINGPVILNYGDFENPKISEHHYKLINNQILSPIYDINHYFKVLGYYEIVDNQVKLANTEFPISKIVSNINPQYAKEHFDKNAVITLYEKADINSKPIKQITPTLSMSIKFIGIKYYEENRKYMAHISIDGAEYWIQDDDIRKLVVFFPEKQTNP